MGIKNINISANGNSYRIVYHSADNGQPAWFNLYRARPVEHGRTEDYYVPCPTLGIQDHYQLIRGSDDYYDAWGDISSQFYLVHDGHPGREDLRCLLAIYQGISQHQIEWHNY